MPNATLEQLWALSQQEAQRTGDAAFAVFGDVGLYLEQPTTNWGYFPTPANSSTFASTHGDSVHYGLLHVNGDVVDASPVVMTVPCLYSAEEGNLIVGENLQEFLCLGCQVGYFCLEQLVYDRQDTVDLISRPERHRELEASEEEQALLRLLASAFGLAPWENVGSRLDELNTQYLPLLELPPEED